MTQDTKTQTGLRAIEAMFARAKEEERAAFLPYFPVGYPNYDESLSAIRAMADAGADGFEIGVPFSDPLADGPTIQAATQVALENGVTVKACIQAVAELRETGVTQPMLLMSYLNPLLAYGVEDVARDAKAAGVDGFIVPDLLVEEASLMAEACAREGLALVFFLAPTSNTSRIKLAGEHATGFIYLVSITGTTGARTELPADLVQFIGRVRAHTDKPMGLGFGISTPEHARMMNGLDVGSALVRAGKEGVEAVRALASSLRQVNA
jgi:tryptophan synthase alpha chain